MIIIMMSSLPNNYIWLNHSVGNFYFFFFFLCQHQHQHQLSTFPLYSIYDGLFINWLSKTGFEFVDIWWPAMHWSILMYTITTQWRPNFSIHVNWPRSCRPSPAILNIFRLFWGGRGWQCKFCSFFSLFSPFFRWLPPPVLVEMPISRKRRLWLSNLTELIPPRFDHSWWLHDGDDDEVMLLLKMIIMK